MKLQGWVFFGGKLAKVYIDFSVKQAQISNFSSVLQSVYRDWRLRGSIHTQSDQVPDMVKVMMSD